MQSGTELFMIMGMISLLIIIGLSFLLMFKIEKIKLLNSSVEKLKKSLEEMDEQAKLIIRTDMELNKTQEELDKKISGLYALQKISRAISTTLEENQIFKLIEPSYLEELGFTKACAFLWSEKDKRFLTHLNIGYFNDELHLIQDSIEPFKDFFLEIIRNEKTFSTISMQDANFKERFVKAFKATSFIISPINPKEGNKGFLFVGTESNDTLVTAGDEELITILSNELGQAMENARLFDNTWKSQQELEKKVEERTRELKIALDEVQSLSRRKTDFVSAVSHELRTPLTSIKGYASILLTGKLGELPREVANRIEKINRHSDELTHLVNDLLDISRIESGRVIMKRESVNLNSFAEKVIDLLSVQLKEKEIKASLQIPEEASTIFADSEQINRVFINLISNAIKFTPKNGKISIVSRKLENEIRTDIIDTGCGIPEEAKEAIFEEFYRVNNAINEQVKGTGLGLTLVKHIIEAHGGKIWVESKAGQGATFSFTIPI